MIDRCTARLHRSNPALHISLFLLVFLLVGLHGCSRLRPVHSSANTVLHGSLGGHPLEHVVIFAVDGLEQETLIKYLCRILHENLEAYTICSVYASMPVVWC